MIVDCAIYEQGKRRDGTPIELDHALEAARKDGAFVWLGLHDPSEGEFDAIRREFELHELAVEDAIKAHQRPKLEDYGDMIFLVLKTARYHDPEEVIDLGEIAVFLGHDFIITVRHGQASSLHDVRERLEHDPELLRCGPGAVLHAILDRVVDDYQPALDGLAHDIEEVEQQVFSPERTNVAERVYKLKREVLEFHRAVAPLVAPVERLAQGSYAQVRKEVQTYFRDVNDHLVRIEEQLDGARDLLTSILSANLTQVSVRQNEDMRKISAWVAIIAVPTMIAGIYGMNFEHMPELKWELGYPAALLVMATLCLTLYRYFKRVGWL